MVLNTVQNLCKRDGISIAKLERSCGLGNATIRRWGMSCPSAKNLRKVADYFDVSMDALAGRPQKGSAKMDA